MLLVTDISGLNLGPTTAHPHALSYVSHCWIKCLKYSHRSLLWKHLQLDGLHKGRGIRHAYAIKKASSAYRIQLI